MSARTLVLGIGNPLLADDGAGIHAIRRLKADPTTPVDVDPVDGGTLSFALTGLVEDADQLIVIDAADLAAVPGTIGLFKGREMDDFLCSHPGRTVHELALLDVLGMALLTGHLPERRALIGIQPERVDWGEELTPAVARSVSRACLLAVDLVAEWRQ